MIYKTRRIFKILNKEKVKMEKNTTKQAPLEMNSQQIVTTYNEIKQKYQVFFQKAIELEDELREHK